MSDNNRIIVRNAREQDIPAVAEIAAEANSSYGTAEKPETFQLQLIAFPNGFIILVAENEIAAYGCSEKWLDEHAPGPNENPLATHQPDGRIFYIKAIARRRKFQGRGYRLLILDKLLETAHLEGCKRVIVETAQAQDLYLQRGFQTSQTRTVQGIPLDVMSLELKSISRNS
jgi:N-acetylglutamate synthase-like GNAT family acetyltransferase